MSTGTRRPDHGHSTPERPRPSPHCWGHSSRAGSGSPGGLPAQAWDRGGWNTGMAGSGGPTWWLVSAQSLLVGTTGPSFRQDTQSACGDHPPAQWTMTWETALSGRELSWPSQEARQRAAQGAWALPVTEEQVLLEGVSAHRAWGGVGPQHGGSGGMSEPFRGPARSEQGLGSWQHSFPEDGGKPLHYHSS